MAPLPSSRIPHRFAMIVAGFALLTACSAPRPLDPTLIAAIRTPGALGTSVAVAPPTLAPATPLPQPTDGLAPAATVPPVSALSPTVATATPPPAPLQPSVVVVVPQLPTQTAEERWRSQQADRQDFPNGRHFVAQSPVELWWFDPATGQSLEIGKLIGPFPASAQFTFLPSGAPALEVPYLINHDYGLTAISPSIVDRIKAAGLGDVINTYVLLTDAIQPADR